ERKSRIEPSSATCPDTKERARVSVEDRKRRDAVFAAVPARVDANVPPVPASRFVTGPSRSRRLSAASALSGGASRISDGSRRSLVVIFRGSDRRWTRRVRTRGGCDDDPPGEGVFLLPRDRRFRAPAHGGSIRLGGDSGRVPSARGGAPSRSRRG